MSQILGKGTLGEQIRGRRLTRTERVLQGEEERKRLEKEAEERRKQELAQERYENQLEDYNKRLKEIEDAKVRERQEIAEWKDAENLVKKGKAFQGSWSVRQKAQYLQDQGMTSSDVMIKRATARFEHQQKLEELQEPPKPEIITIQTSQELIDFAEGKTTNLPEEFKIPPRKETITDFAVPYLHRASPTSPIVLLTDPLFKAGKSVITGTEQFI